MADDTFTILLVDDNEVRQMIWRPRLEHEGYRVLTAGDGEEALQMLSRELVDLILLDVKMPGKSGFEVLEILRQQRTAEELPVMMMTGLDQEADIIKGFHLGANDYVAPEAVGEEVVLARVRAQLRDRIPARSSKKNQENESDPPGPGTLLDGKYRLDTLIGRGSFGAVFRGTHLQLQRPVAIKILRTNFGTDEVALARFQQEGISLSRLEHPNAVSVLDFNVSSKDVAYLVMELLQGKSLDQVLRRQGALSPRRALEISIPVCDVLAEAHSLGIIHRDIKPQNIFLHTDRRGEVIKVLDFGIAKLVGDADLQQQLTIEGNSVGTPAYMAPERFTNEPYDGRTDVYSLAISLYEMLTGRTPFAGVDGNFFKLIRMHVVERPKALLALKPNLLLQLNDIVMQALAKKCPDRPTAAEMASVLRECLAELPPKGSAMEVSATADSAADGSLGTTGGSSGGGDPDDADTVEADASGLAADTAEADLRESSESSADMIDPPSDPTVEWQSEPS